VPRIPRKERLNETMVKWTKIRCTYNLGEYIIDLVYSCLGPIRSDYLRIVLRREIFMLSGEIHLFEALCSSRPSRFT
jgi:hypothetical protein